MSDLVYTVTAYRWGSRENHSYVVGVYSSDVKALDAADREEAYRGGKYDCEVIGWAPDQGLAGLDRKQDSARTVLRPLPRDSTKAYGHADPVATVASAEELRPGFHRECRLGHALQGGLSLDGRL